MLGNRTHTSTLALLSLTAALLLPACDEGEPPDDDIGESSGEGDGDGDDTAATFGVDSRGDGQEEGSGAEEGESDSGELFGCAALDSEADCQADAQCTPVLGLPLVDDGAGGLCELPDDDFIGCVSINQLCPGGTKTVCVGDTSWSTQGCVPDNAALCEPEGELSGPC